MMREKTGTMKQAWLAALPCGLVALGMATQTVSAANYSNVIASQTPLLYWRMNEAVNDGSVPDLITEVNNLDALLGTGNFTHSANLGNHIVVAQSSMEPSSGFDGFEAGNTSFNFNTSGAGSVVDQITLPRNSMGMAAGSISMWVNATDPNAADPFASGVLYRGDEGGGNYLNLIMFGDIVAVNLMETEIVMISNGTDGTVDYSDGLWHHVVATWSYDINTDQGAVSLYMDGGTLAGGEQVSTSFTSADYAPILQQSDPVNNPGVFDRVMHFDTRNRMGKGATNAHRYNGNIDEPALFNRALTPAEIAAQYQAAFEAGDPALDGDLNDDGFVGLADLDIVLGNWNQNVTPGSKADGDPSGDGFVGLADLDTVLGNWNAGIPPAANAVPEPATLALLGLGGLIALRRKH